MSSVRALFFFSTLAIAHTKEILDDQIRLTCLIQQVFAPKQYYLLRITIILCYILIYAIIKFSYLINPTKDSYFE